MSKGGRKSEHSQLENFDTCPQEIFKSNEPEKLIEEEVAVVVAKFEIEDRSTNGTFLNKERHEKFKRYELKNDDRMGLVYTPNDK